MAAAAAALDNLTDQDDFDRVAAAVLSKWRIAQLGVPLTNVAPAAI